MVIKIHQVASTENALMYNEKKVKQGTASFFDSRNTVSTNPFMYGEKHRLNSLLDIEKLNPRVKNKCFHISFNPSAEDYVKLGDTAIQKEIGNMMKYMGYGNQPYFVYKHQDLERTHFHVVSTRIDRETGRKIKDSYEKQKMQKFIHDLEQKYELTQPGNKEIPDFKFSPRSRNIKQNLENLFLHLNQVKEISSKGMYNEALKFFHVEIRQSGRGHIVVVNDGKGNPIRYPIRLSNFKERPKFYKIEQQNKNSKKDRFKKEINQGKDISDLGVMNSKLPKELLKQLILHLTNDFKEKDKKYRLKSGKRKIKRRF